jgi:GNAT superfamily N-acetyltransferase
MQPVGLDDPAARALLTALADEYASRYGSDEEMATTTAAEFEPPHGLFLVLFDEGGNAVAGGGFRRHAPDACEVKRMWTAATHRRRGLASQVLAALEDEARSAGYRRVILETGPEQPEAHAMYRNRGYATAPNLGRYADATAYEKALG